MDNSIGAPENIVDDFMEHRRIDKEGEIQVGETSKRGRGRPPKVRQEVKQEIEAEEEIKAEQPKDVPDDVKIDAPLTGVTPVDEYNLHIVRDYYGQVDIWYLSKKDPRYEYRFLNVSSKNLALKTSNLLHQSGGWQICGRGHLLSLGLSEKELAPDGTLRRGDTVLAFIPKELAQEKANIKKRDADERIDNIRRLYQEGNPEIGRDIEGQKAGLLPEEKLDWKKDYR